MTEDEYIRACNIAYITAANEALRHVMPDWLKGTGGAAITKVVTTLYQIHQDELEHLNLDGETEDGTRWIEIAPGDKLNLSAADGYMLDYGRDEETGALVVGVDYLRQFDEDGNMLPPPDLR